MEYIDPPKTRRETKKTSKDKRSNIYNARYVRLVEKIIERKSKRTVSLS